MSIKLMIGGIPVEVSNASEAADLLREINAVPKAPLNGTLTSSSTGKQATQRSKSAESHASKEHRVPNGLGGFDARASAIDLLEAVRSAGPNGLAREKAMTILHADHPKGVGARMATINKVFAEAGIDPEKVLETTRSLERGRIWHPGEQLTEALEKLSE